MTEFQEYYSLLRIRLLGGALAGATGREARAAQHQVDRELPDVMWLNYFGPSWLKRTDRMLGLGYDEMRTSNGGVVLQMTETPFVFERDVHPVLGYSWKQPLIDALGKDTFKWSEQVQGAPGQLVPSWEEHFAASPGTSEMPWANWKGDEAERKRAAREKTFRGRSGPLSSW
jgi:hypothetical protein